MCWAILWIKPVLPSNMCWQEKGMIAHVGEKLLAWHDLFRKHRFTQSISFGFHAFLPKQVYACNLWMCSLPSIFKTWEPQSNKVQFFSIFWRHSLWVSSFKRRDGRSATAVCHCEPQYLAHVWFGLAILTGSQLGAAVFDPFSLKPTNAEWGVEILSAIPISF